MTDTRRMSATLHVPADLAAAVDAADRHMRAIHGDEDSHGCRPGAGFMVECSRAVGVRRSDDGERWEEIPGTLDLGHHVYAYVSSGGERAAYELALVTRAQRGWAPARRPLDHRRGVQRGRSMDHRRRRALSGGPMPEDLKLPTDPKALAFFLADGLTRRRIALELDAGKHKAEAPAIAAAALRCCERLESDAVELAALRKMRDQVKAAIGTAP